jgi:hypothetical protein
MQDFPEELDCGNIQTQDLISALTNLISLFKKKKEQRIQSVNGQKN